MMMLTADKTFMGAVYSPVVILTEKPLRFCTLFLKDDWK